MNSAVIIIFCAGFIALVTLFVVNAYCQRKLRKSQKEFDEECGKLRGISEWFCAEAARMRAEKGRELTKDEIKELSKECLKRLEQI